MANTKPVVTSACQAVTPAQGAYALFLTAKGRVVADVRIVADGAGGLWIDTDAAAVPPLEAHLK